MPVSLLALAFTGAMVAVRAWALMLLVGIVHAIWIPQLHTLGYLNALALAALASLAFLGLRATST